MNDPKPSISGQITKPNTSNNSRFKNINPYKIKINNISTTSPFSEKSFKKCFKCGCRPPYQYNKFSYEYSIPIQGNICNGALL